MEQILCENTFHGFSLENYYFTEQSIVVAALNYLRSLNNNCKFLGIDIKNIPIIQINNSNYKLLYKSNFIGLISFDSISIKKIDDNFKLDSNNYLSNSINMLLEEDY